MIGRKDEMTSMWFNKTVVGVTILLFLTSVVAWATGIGASMSNAEANIIRIDTELANHRVQATLDRTETREAFTRLEKKLDRLIERR